MLLDWLGSCVFLKYLQLGLGLVVLRVLVVVSRLGQVEHRTERRMTV